MIWFRHADPRYPFLWESTNQPPARWHGAGEGPVHYFSDTAEGAWAEFLRHEGITHDEDLKGIRRSIWAVEVDDQEVDSAVLAAGAHTVGGPETYERCRDFARRLTAAGRRSLRAPAAALVSGGAHGWRMDGGIGVAPKRTGFTLALFGRRPELIGWSAAHTGQPDPHILPLVRPLT